MLQKLEREFAVSNISALSEIIEKTPLNSLTRLSLQSKRANFETALQAMNDTLDRHASTALFFSGDPVLQSRGIESEFASKAIFYYQEIVTKLFALRTRGPLGERGVVADRDLSKLHVTSILRGSFGFLLEDAHEPDAHAAPILKSVVDDSARLLGSFAEEDEEHFASALSEIDNRVLGSVKAFFDTLAKDSATLRVIAGASERVFDGRGIARASERANAITVETNPETLSGLLQGVMPDRHEFELLVDGRVIFGRVLPEVPELAFVSLYRKNVTASLIRTDVRRGGQLLRNKYLMTALQADEKEPTTSAQSPFVDLE